jgi:microcystin-dependent protein
MAGTTSRYELPYPGSSDNNNVPSDMQALANAVDTKLGALEDRQIDLAHLAAAVQSLLVPTGSVFATARVSAPSGYLICDGSAVSRTTYSALFSAIGTTYGSGNGSTTFNLPNLNGRTVFGVGTPTGASGATNHTLAQKAGEETHALSTSEMPNHNHTITDPGHSHAPWSGGQFLSTSGSYYFSSGGTLDYNASFGTTSIATTGITISSAGSGLPHSNLPPYLVLTYVIKI